MGVASRGFGRGEKLASGSWAVLVAKEKCESCGFCVAFLEKWDKFYATFYSD
jgi:hypothetical protein